MKVISNNLNVNAVIEKTAKALAWMTLTEHGKETCKWETDFAESEKVLFRAQAKTVIAAIRDAPDDMVIYNNYYYCERMWKELNSKAVWQLWIDAILKE